MTTPYDPTVTQSWAHRVAVMVDMTCGVFCGLRYDETISAHCGLVCYGAQPANPIALRLFWKPLRAILELLEPHHCDLAIEADEMRARAVLAELERVTEIHPTKE